MQPTLLGRRYNPSLVFNSPDIGLDTFFQFGGQVFQIVRTGQRVNRLGDPGFLLNDLLRPQ